MNRAEPRERPPHPSQSIPRLAVVTQCQARLHASGAGRNLNGNRVRRRAAGADRKSARRGHLRLGEH